MFGFPFGIKRFDFQVNDADGDFRPDRRKRRRGNIRLESMFFSVFVFRRENVSSRAPSARGVKSRNEHKLRGIDVPERSAVDAAEMRGCLFVVVLF